MNVWPILVAAAVLEVAGDAMIRLGIRGRGVAFIVAGFLVLGSYGLFVNKVPLDFSRLLCAYVAAFAVVGVLAGPILFHEKLPASTWLGLAIVVTGGLVIQFGPRFH